MQTIDEALSKLKKSDFRSRFHLKQKDIDYINEKGMDKIRSHAEDFVRTRLAPKYIPNDGKQTPMRGHPVLSHSTPVPVVAEGVLTSGTELQGISSLTRSNSRKL